MWYLIRHPETEWNRTGRYQGWRDLPLSTFGEWQRQELLLDLLHLPPIAAVLSSDLERCLTVASPLARQLGCPLLVQPELRELNFGSWEGLTFEQISAQFPERQADWLADPRLASPPGGETLLQLQQRVQAVLTPWLTEQVVIVTHGGVIAAILNWLIGPGLHLPPTASCWVLDQQVRHYYSFGENEHPPQPH